MIGWGLLFGGTLVAGLVACRVSLALVTRLRMVAVPNERSSHHRPTPTGGGIGILLALVPGVTVGALLVGEGRIEVLGAVVFATLVLALLGYLDDRKGAGPGAKVVLQLLAGGAILAAVGWIDTVTLPGVGSIPLGVLAVPLTLFWLVGFSNGYNFMDGIDGIAALHAGLAALLMTAAVFLSGRPGPLWLLVPLAAACLSFLSVNWHPARIFMGDVGSLPVGFLLAAAAVMARKVEGVPFLTSFLILGPFLFDTMFTLVRRLLRRENVLAAHRSHLYQRLVVTGLTHSRVTVFYAGWTLFTGGLGLLYLSGGTGVRAGALLAALLSGIGVAVWVQHRERTGRPR